MELTDKQHKLLEFARKKHEGQVRKYTGEPYINHPLSVANIVYNHLDNGGAVEAAICHDLLEDTDCTAVELGVVLADIGYSIPMISHIVHMVKELTDRYTTERFPDVNREVRKGLEAVRLGRTNMLVQSIKYADLIDNTSSIVKYDKVFAKVYLAEKRELLDNMRGGDIGLLIECCSVLRTAMEELDS